ncbi:MAG: hypothetical protein ACPGUV_12260 [Polyangiales bacterium]
MSTAAAQSSVRVVPKQKIAAGPEHAIIPRPEQRPPYLVGQAHVMAVFPLRNTALCPADAACIYGGGGGVLGSIELRWPWGLGLGAQYQAWLLDGNGVHELSLQHGLGPLLRYVLPTQTVWHPFAVLSPQWLALGDAPSLPSFGFGLDFGLGVEIEMSASLSFVAQASSRLFSTRAFTTESDDVRRAGGTEINAALSLHVGLAIAQIP